VLFGEQDGQRITALDLAQRRTTISYEVVTAMARRVARVYYRSAVPVGLRTLTEETYAWRSSNSGTETSATSRWTRS
jgi:alanine racemase-like protein